MNSIYRAIVTNNLDPEKRGRIKVSCPNVLGEYESNWCLPCYPFTGFSNGCFYLPELNAPVWIMFEEGNIDTPIWIGGWSIPTLPPPTDYEIENNLVKENLLPTHSKKEGPLYNFFALASKFGGISIQKDINNSTHFILHLNDTDFLTLTVDEKNNYILKLFYDDNKISMNKEGIHIENKGGNIHLNNNGIAINAKGELNLNASGNVNIHGSKINLN